MADTFVVGQVNVCDLVGAEEDPVLAIAGERSDGDALTSKRLRDEAGHDVEGSERNKDPRKTSEPPLEQDLYEAAATMVGRCRSAEQLRTPCERLRPSC